MIVLQLSFTDNEQQYLADVELEGIADSWDADITISGHPSVHTLHAKCWLGAFLQPVFGSRQEAKLFEPLLEAIDAAAKAALPEAFDH